MGDTYSLYEAKARLSEIVRMVREQGRTITISYHGQPVAEVRPIKRAGGLGARLRDLEASGRLVPARAGDFPLTPVAKRPGALGRFLADRSRF
jgi:prevent-host-death family protein